MGGGIGGAFGPTPSNLDENIKRLSATHQTSRNGRFGIRSNGKVRVVSSPDPNKTAQTFFKTLSQGASITSMLNGKGVIARFSDGSFVSYRANSTSGGPAIYIQTNSPSLGYKIHFLRDEGESQIE